MMLVVRSRMGNINLPNYDLPSETGYISEGPHPFAWILTWGRPLPGEATLIYKISTWDAVSSRIHLHRKGLALS